NPLAEEVLNKLASDKGIPRIRLICNSQVNVDAGLNERLVSFQSVALPFIALLIRNGIRESTFERQVNAIYSAVYAYIDSFIQDQVLNCVDELIRRKSLRDTSVEEQALLKNNAFIPVTCAQILLVLVRFINEILGRIREAKVNMTIQVIGGRLEQANNAWKDLLTSGHIVGDILSDGVADKPPYCFTVIDRELDKMKRILNMGKQSLEKGEENVKSSSENVSIDAKIIATQIELQRDYDPPGELSKLGKRHDNDAVNFQDIHIVPTSAEIFCKRSPFLPSSHSYAPHFLSAGPKRFLDIQF
ncbi:957_t:CDS:2, partial [Paraglomus brasilianum]